ncbi:Peptidyl-prolyl cis-trans isomerase CWC27-like protein [Hordeum vulgare]|nr:Peptidyl-prolyl cis-trans isomerase CWC27-like protein [Hordeum vulgare]
MKPNARLQPKALQLIEDIRMAVHSACGPTVSCADITVHAARDAVVVAIAALEKGAHLLKCGKRGKPRFSPFRLSCVLWNPFDDIVPRQLTKIQPAPRADAERKPEKKVVKLCFGSQTMIGRRLLTLISGEQRDSEGGIWGMGVGHGTWDVGDYHSANYWKDADSSFLKL